MRSRGCCAAVAASLLVACAGSEPAGAPHIPSLGPSARFMSGNARGRSLNDELRDLETRAPGFAGIYYDSLGRLTIAVSRRSFSAGDVAQVMDWAAGYWGSVRRDMVPRIALTRYSYRQLDSVRFRVFGARAYTLPYVHGVGIDVQGGQVLFLVNNQAAAASLMNEALALGVAGDMLHVVVSSPPSALPGLQQTCNPETDPYGCRPPPPPPPPPDPTLRDRVSPVYGGLQGTWFTTGGECTLAFNAYRVTALGNGQGYPDASLGNFALTASHCGRTRGFADPQTVWGQPYATTRVGIEEAAGPILTQGCHPGQFSCQAADVMVIRYDAGLSTGYGVLEKTNLSSIAITGQQPMNPQLYGALVGHHILKTGRTTGTTQGVVRYLCVDSNTIQYPSIWTLCSDVADYASDYGDSGSPVYVQYDPTVTNTPRAVGIHWGSGSGLSYYSPPQQIWAALAYQFYF